MDRKTTLSVNRQKQSFNSVHAYFEIVFLEVFLKNGS